ncbi:protein transport protein HofC [Atlantibacter hermannii]|uniref:protein transport protein HofC n=1 Tax=Atlantibacter hermannii TaxID=565 RepID=UPI0019349365|nr:protein transport protein HofC [Atlantibacter hermannii]MBL7635001.1 protein transport protein HofC [Atlantibacter hermannii]MBL7675147.1 protein transport protein HofC [Atlantibacter hermannii]
MNERRLWQWSGLNDEGAPCGGLFWAADRPTALQQLYQQNIWPLKLKRHSVARQYWNLTYKIHFIRQLATLLQAGIALPQGLSMLAEQHSRLQWQALLWELAQQVTQGVPFSEALKAWPRVFSPLFIALIRTGEITGKLDECCQRLAAQQEEQQALRKKVVKALRYPGIIFVMALLVTIGMAGFVLPEFAAIYRAFNAPLPALTQGVMAFSAFITGSGHWLALLTGALIGVVLRCRRNPNWQWQEQNLLLRLPLVGELVRGQRLSQIYTILAMTQQAGLPLLQGLEAVVQTLESPFWRQMLERIMQKIADGVPFWKTLEEEKGFTPLCRQLIYTAEETGSMDLMLARLAHWHTGQTHERADSLSSTLEPLMMVVIGLIVGTLVIAMYLPVFQMGDAMSGAG